MLHSLGAMHLMGEAIAQLRLTGQNISATEEDAARACMLLHDIGHGPFSHTLENSIVQGTSHEDISLWMMQRINDDSMAGSKQPCRFSPISIRNIFCINSLPASWIWTGSTT